MHIPITEADVERAALDWFAAFGWQVAYGLTSRRAPRRRA